MITLGIGRGKGRLMRWVVCAAVAFGIMLGLTPNAFAGDFDVLRGSQSVGPATFTRWSGVYVGGQIGYGNASADFSGATQAPIAYNLRELALENEDQVSQWPVLGTNSAGKAQYGGFIGFNTQWQDLILGFEANYNRTGYNFTAPNSPISRVTSAGGNSYAVTVSGSGSVTNLDFGSLRARAGWVLGNFLPYGFAGLAVGRADIAVTTDVSGQQNPPTPSGPCDPVSSPTCVAFDFPSSQQKNASWLLGFVVGGGVDVAVTSNIFVRGEFEYARFSPVSGILVAATSARIGAGVKF
jgi:outer membrane immunogenic protein